jgi:F420-non-reducing hydrogenase small subunit
MLAAIASVIQAGAPGETEEEIEKQVQAAVDSLADPAGTFYRFSMAHSLLNRKRTNGRNPLHSTTDPKGGA